MGCVSEKNGNSQQRLAWTFWSFASLFTSCQRWRKKASELLIILFSSISLCSVGKCLQKQQPSASLNGRKCGEVHTEYSIVISQEDCVSLFEGLSDRTVHHHSSNIMQPCTCREIIITAVHRTAALKRFMLTEKKRCAFTNHTANDC